MKQLLTILCLILFSNVSLGNDPDFLGNSSSSCRFSSDGSDVSCGGQSSKGFYVQRFNFIYQSSKFCPTINSNIYSKKS